MSTAKTPEPPPVSRFELRATPGTTFDRASDSLAISPDGRTFAWSACEAATGRCALYLRAIDHLDAQRLAGTEEGHSPVFSPDGRWIAFFADGALKKIAVAGGAATTLASAPDPAGAAWGRDGTIAFAGSAAGAVSAVNEQGGAVRTLTSPQTASGQLRDRDPAWLSDGALMFTVTRLPGMDSAGELAAVTRADPRSRTLRTGIVRAVPAGDYLLLATASGLQATTFDQRTLALGGSSDAVPAPGDGTPQCAAAAEVLAIVPSSGAARRVWADGADATPLARLTAMAIAPDSRRAAGVIVEGDAADIWLADLDSGALTRLTFGGSSISPVWSADGRHVLYATRTSNGPYTVVSRAVENRNGPPAPVAGAPAAALPTSAAGDGRIAITTYAADALHLVVALLAPGAAPRVLTDGPFDETNAVFSPDGRWLALESTESGRTEIVVRSATDGHRIAISAGGGRTPRWSQDGHAIYYESGRRLMRAAFSPDAASHTPPETILDRAGERAVAVTPSGRVLIERRPDADTAIVVQQWLRELRDRLPLPVNAPR